MAEWSVTVIAASPGITCVSSTGVVIPPRPIKIWDPNTDYTDGATGSIYPVTFFTPSSAIDKVLISLKGTCRFPSYWRGKRFFVGAWYNNTQVFISDKLTVPDAGENFTVDNLLLLGENTINSAVPFRWAGDFIWRIALVESPEQSFLAIKNTRLELCWARDVAPNGPRNPPPDIPSRVDLSPGYPIGLFRLFAPSPIDFPSPLPANMIVWYVHRSMGLIWNESSIKPRYDTAGGRSYYNMWHLGGSFNLDGWMKKDFPACNCYDLAAIAQLSCTLLVDASQNKDLVDSRWVSQWRRNDAPVVPLALYINPGPLYGWVQFGGDHLRCNTPFWASRGTRPYVEWDSTDRTSFGNHAWVEISLGGLRVVIDATHKLTDDVSPESGTHNRVEYASRSNDARRSIYDTNDYVNGSGSCWINPISQTYRIGVYDASGLPYPTQLSMLPETSRDLEQTLERGKSYPQPEPAFSIAPIHPQTLLPELFPDSDFEQVGASVSVKPSIVQVTIKVKPKQQDLTNIEVIILSLSVFSSFESPISALTSYLLGFQIEPLFSFIEKCENPLGAFSFRTQDSVFWVRGNHFIKIEEFMTDTSPRVRSSSVFEISKRLDDYLAPKTEREDHGVPRFSLDESFQRSPIYCGQKFSLKLTEDDALLGDKRATSEDPEIILPAGPPSDLGELEFYAMSVGKAEVSIYAADAVTLRPGKISFELQVVPAVDD